MSHVGRLAIAPGHALAAWAAVIVAMVEATPGHADDALTAWRTGVAIQAVSPHANRHVIHSYFNTSPESPDGRFVLYYTSETPAGEQGDLRILERATGVETVLAEGLTTEDAHRAACQQWSNGGRTVLYHDCVDGRWRVVAIDVAARTYKVLAHDRQLAFGSPVGQWAPIYGCHWNPGPHRHLELVHVETGEVRTVLRIEDVIREYGDWIQSRFGTHDVSVFFPILSHDEGRVFFKLARPSGVNDFRSSRASERDGKIVYDVKEQRFIRLIEQWGHPSWSPDGRGIFEKGNVLLDVETGRQRRSAPSCISDHPSMSPDSRLFVTDADVTKRMYGQPGDWAIAVGSMTADDFVILDVFPNGRGATSWRHNHPHPAFSADGSRIYFNVNSSPWTQLMVAERGKSIAQP